jgi:hypothetical protein
MIKGGAVFLLSAKRNGLRSKCSPLGPSACRKFICHGWGENCPSLWKTLYSTIYYMIMVTCANSYLPLTQGRGGQTQRKGKKYSYFSSKCHLGAEFLNSFFGKNFGFSKNSKIGTFRRQSTHSGWILGYVEYAPFVSRSVEICKSPQICIGCPVDFGILMCNF